MTDAPDDTIDVRPDEQFDEDALADYLRGRLPGADAPLTVRQFGGGKANLTYLLDYGAHAYVLRRPPLGPVAEFDWDMCTLGDPRSDVGALLTYWVQPDDPAPFQRFATMPVDDRFLSRAALLERYATQSGRSVQDIRFYHTLGLYRLTAIVAQIFIRYRRGQTKDERFAGLGPMIQITAQAARDVAVGTWP